MTAPDAQAPGGGAAAALARDDGGPAFREIWEAQAFAIVTILRDRGVFTPAEWAEALAAEIRRAQAAGDPDTGETYYRHWLAALERIVVAKNLATADALALTRDAWAAAAARTPHGTPIELARDDFAAGRARNAAPSS